MVDILKQATVAINSTTGTINNTLGGFNSAVGSNNTAVGSLKKMLQAVQVFSKMNEQPATVSKPDIAEEKFGNSTQIVPKVQLVNDERTNPTCSQECTNKKEKTRGAIFLRVIYLFPGPNEFFPRARTKSSMTKAKHGEYT